MRRLFVAVIIAAFAVFISVDSADAQRGIGRGLYRGMKGPGLGQDHAGGIVVSSGDPCAGDCTTETQSEEGEYVSNGVLGRYADYAWYASKFTAASTYYVCKMNLNIWKNLSPTGNVTAYIYTDNADEPGTQIGDASDPIVASGLGTTNASWAMATNICASVSNGVSYWIVLYNDTIDANNYVKPGQSDAGAVEHTMRSADGLSWIEATSDRTFKYEIYKP